MLQNMPGKKTAYQVRDIEIQHDRKCMKPQMETRKKFELHLELEFFPSFHLGFHAFSIML